MAIEEHMGLAAAPTARNSNTSATPLAEGSDAKFQGKQGEFPGKEAVQARVEAFMTKVDTDGDGMLTIEELHAVLPDHQAWGLAGKSKEEVVELSMGFFGAVSTNILCLGWSADLSSDLLVCT